MHGECLALMAGLPDKSVDLIACDLPYGTTQNAWDSVIDLPSMWVQYRRICRGAIVLTAQCPFDKVLGASNLRELKYEWIWRKEQGTGHLNAKKAPMKDHENILVFYPQQTTYNPQMRTGFQAYTQIRKPPKSDNYGDQTACNTLNDGTRYPLTVIDFPRDKSRFHPTQKPVALMDYLIRTYTNEGDTVLDNCMGSGTTGEAAVRAGRNFIGMEMNAEYFTYAQMRVVKAWMEANGHGGLIAPPANKTYTGAL